MPDRTAPWLPPPTSSRRSDTSSHRLPAVALHRLAPTSYTRQSGVKTPCRRRESVTSDHPDPDPDHDPDHDHDHDPDRDPDPAPPPTPPPPAPPATRPHKPP